MPDSPIPQWDESPNEACTETDLCGFAFRISTSPRIRSSLVAARDYAIQSICVANIFDSLGNNRAAVHWNIELSNREGREGENSGVSVLDIRGGKVVLMKDFMLDLGENFRRNWSAG